MTNLHIAALSIALLAAAVVTRADADQTSGPCGEGGAAAVVDRPGLGRPTADNGSPCVVPAGHVFLEAGYRTQATDGRNGTSVLDTYPTAILRVGVDRQWELLVQPPALAVRGGAGLGGVFVPASGSQDGGAGVKRTLHDQRFFQDAVEAFVTFPTGTPQGSAGFSAGGPTYTLSYTTSFTLSSIFSASITQNAIAGAAPLSPAGAVRYFSYQPSLTLAYGFAPNTTLLVSDQLSSPVAPGAGTGNRALAALQRALSRAVVIDVDYEINTLPGQPAIRQHAFGGGVAVLF